MKIRSSREAKAREFSTKARKEIVARDLGQCIFCQRNYRMEGATWYELGMLSIMHYVPRSKNGLGITENGALGCQFHHAMLDNGKDGRREEMLEIFRNYLKAKHKDWNEEKLTYNKWTFEK